MNKWGEVLKIFVMGDEFDGLQAIQVANWSGQAFLGRREQIYACSKRDELSKTAVYLLLSDDQTEEGLFQVYVGETDTFINRIKQHNQQKDWWDRFIVFVSGDDNLTKAHAKYLEEKLYSLINQASDYVELMNSGIPTSAKLPESEISFAEGFLENIGLVLNTLGHRYLLPMNLNHVENIDAQTSASSNSGVATLRRESYHYLNGQKFKISLPQDEAESLQSPEAQMRVENGKFILEKGSVIRAVAAPSFLKKSHSYYLAWERVVKEKSSEIKGTQYYKTINEDLTWDAPSSAGAVCMARSVNGLTVWKRMKDGKRLKECLTENIKQVDLNAA